ncbi:MAG: hypothetical protein Q4A26_03435 [Candidatus Saccharibacteria bacterium]|nr:hypothetical protein [Candidatus Saccharibacteria bacterium]
MKTLLKPLTKSFFRYSSGEDARAKRSPSYVAVSAKIGRDVESP